MEPLLLLNTVNLKHEEPHLLVDQNDDILLFSTMLGITMLGMLTLMATVDIFLAKRLTMLCQGTILSIRPLLRVFLKMN